MNWDSSPDSSARSSTSTNYSITTQSQLTPDTKHDLYDLQEATNNFSDKKIIVMGEFGITYEGKLKSGETVAVKRYDVEKNIYSTYSNELAKLGKTNHPNLVALKGDCEDLEGENVEFILVHEFMKFGTLADHLFGVGVVKEMPLPWEKRLKICINVAKALRYIHEEFGIHKRLIHRNVNPTNILLTEDLTAKLSEFGFAREVNANTQDSAVKTIVRGTTKYVDPSYQLTGMLTRKSDIYSYGVVLLDVLFGKNFPILFGTKDPNDVNGHKKEHLREWTLKCLNEGTLHLNVDERIKEQISEKCLGEFVEIATSCLEEDPLKRPKMSQVLKKLEYMIRDHR